jgi:hypothetical protein
MDDFRNIYESHHTNNKVPLKGSVMLVATPPTKGKKFPKQFKKSCRLCDKQGQKSVDCVSIPENAHKQPGFKANEKTLTTTTPTSARTSITCTYGQKTGHSEKQCFKKKNAEGQSNDKVAAMFMVNEHGFLTKGPSHTLTNITFIADSGATCHMRGSLEGMFDMKPYVTDIMVGNNDTMATVSNVKYKGFVLQKNGTTVDIVLQDVVYVPKLMVNWFSLTKAIENTGVAQSSIGQIISLTVGTTEIYFDKVFKHGSGRLLGIKIHPTPK